MSYPDNEGGTWYGANVIETQSGAPYNFIDPVPRDLTIEDIAWPLATTNRFGSHAKPFWSVAQHSVFCVEILEAWGWTTVHSPLILKGCLMHDAHEAFLGDVPRPAKPLYGEPYRNLAKLSDAAISRRFRIPDRILHNPLIKKADQIAMVNEGHRVMRKGPPPEEMLSLPRGLALPQPQDHGAAYETFVLTARRLGIE